MTPRSILMLSTHGYVAGEPELGKPDTGGQVVFVLELAKEFARAGHQVDIVTRRFEDQPAQEILADNLRLLRIPYGGPDFVRKEDMHDHLNELIWKLDADIQKRFGHYDLVNSHYWDAGWAGQAIAEILDVPHIHTPHSLGAWKRQGMRSAKRDGEGRYRFEERIDKERKIYDRCQTVVATSPEQRDHLADFYHIDAGKIAVIPPGLDENRFAPPASETSLQALRDRYEMTPHDIYAVGRAATNKGYDLLIQSMPHVLKQVEDARLLLAVGADSKRDRRLVQDWKDQAEQIGVADHVRWLDYIPDDEMADRYRSAGVFALSSRYEPFGMTAAEAMACGTPTVVTTHGGLQDFVTDGTHALVADPHDAEAFAQALAGPMVDADLRRQLSQVGAQYARQQFSWSGIAAKTLKRFEQAIEAQSISRLEPWATVGH